MAADLISVDQVQHIARLARLELSREELERSRAELSRILGHMALLNDIDTTAVEPTAHPLPLRNVMRDDVPTPSFDAELALRNAPGREDAFFGVPKVLDQSAP